MRDLCAIVLLACSVSGCLRKYDDFEVGPASTGVNTSQTRSDAAVPDVTHGGAEPTSSEVGTDSGAELDDAAGDDEESNAALDAAIPTASNATSAASTATDEAPTEPSTRDAGPVLPSSETQDDESIIAPLPNDAGRELDAATDGGSEEAPAVCGSCNPLREVCDTDCSRTQEQCLLDCTDNPGKCRRDCGAAQQSCALACLDACDECYLSEGCIAVCDE